MRYYTGRQRRSLSLSGGAQLMLLWHLMLSLNNCGSGVTSAFSVRSATFSLHQHQHQHQHHASIQNTNFVRKRNLLRSSEKSLKDDVGANANANANAYENGNADMTQKQTLIDENHGQQVEPITKQQSLQCSADECVTVSVIQDEPLEVAHEPAINSKRSRFLSSLPAIAITNNKSKKVQFGDETDTKILASALPSMLNMAVVPLVNSVDTFWVGRLGITLALAGQSAANSAFFTLYFLVSFLPTITAPLVATAVASGDMDEAQNKVCEALFLSNLLGAIGTVMLVGFPRTSLGLVLAKDAAAMDFAVPYLRFRALSMIPALISSTGFAAYRGLLNTVTPLKVSLATNLFNLIADPLLIFGLPTKSAKMAMIVPSTLHKLGPLGFITKGLGVGGAAIATAGAETLSGIIYLRLLTRRKLLSISKMMKIPSWESIRTIVQGGSAMLLFQLVLNIAFLTAARRVQAMDPTGVAAAAYGIVMQLYSVGVVCHLGVKATAATLVPAEKSKHGTDAARTMADKLFVWGGIVGIILGIAQMAALPMLIPMFTTIPEVRDAIYLPALISSFIQFVNGPLFAGEGVMVGLGTFKALTSCTILGAGIMVSCICSPMGKSLNGILLSLAAFNFFQAAAMVYHHLKMGPLAVKRSGVEG